MTDVLNVKLTGLKDVEQVTDRSELFAGRFATSAEEALRVRSEKKTDVRKQLENAIDEAVSNAESAIGTGVDFDIIADWLMLIAISYKYKAHQEPE